MKIRRKEMRGDNHEIEQIIGQVYQRKQESIQNPIYWHKQQKSLSNTMSSSKQMQNSSLAFSNKQFDRFQQKVNPWESQGSIDGGQQINLDDYTDHEESPQQNQIFVQYNDLKQQTQKTFDDYQSHGVARGFHDPVVKKIGYNANSASMKRVERIQEKVQNILNHKREKSNTLENKQKITNTYCNQMQINNQAGLKNDINKHKNYLINENMNTMPNHKIISDKREVLQTKKTNEFMGSVRYTQEPKEVFVDLASNINKNKNIPYLTKIKSTSNHVARSSSASKTNGNKSFNTQNKINNLMHNQNINNTGTLPNTQQPNDQQYQTPVKRIIKAFTRNQNDDIYQEKKIREKSLTDQTNQHSYKTPIRSEDIVLKQKNTNTQIEVKISSPYMCNEDYKQVYKQFNLQNTNQKNKNQQGYDSERALRPYTAQASAKKQTILNQANTPQANHMTPDLGAISNTNQFNYYNNCNQNDLFDTHISIQQFKVEGELGKGSYATVKHAFDKNSGEQYALKIYQKFTLNDVNKMRNVKREISILKRISHPNIIKMPYAFQDKNTVYIIFLQQKIDYLIQPIDCFGDGISIKVIITQKKQDRKIPESQAKMIFHQLVSGIDYCHMRNIVHRDIKLENILIEEATRNVKIIDFGFSICSGTKLKIFCGTPTYMAPEIVSKIEYCGKKADVWALGIVLYLLFCGKFPFKGMSDSELFKKIKSCVYDAPSNISDQGLALLKKLLKFNPSERPDCYEISQDPWFYSG